MTPYSFEKEAGYGFDQDNYPSSNQRKRIRRNWHVPESRHNARSGSLGSFSSITSMYNNVYGQQDDNQEEPSID